MTDYEIFRVCFPMLKLPENVFRALSGYDSCTRFAENGGFALVSGHSIVLIAVLPEYRRRGIGSRLLALCEQHIAALFKLSLLAEPQITLGGSLLYGAPEDAAGFFAKHGYETDGMAHEMQLALDAVPDYAWLTNSAADITYGFYHGTLDQLKAAAAEVDGDWVQYFDIQHTFCAMRGDKLISFCIAGVDDCCLLSDGVSKIGSIGCVGTVPDERGQQTGLKMVALATEYLRSIGCGKCFIHYTHIDHWYAKLGYKSFFSFVPCQKPLK